MSPNRRPDRVARCPTLPGPARPGSALARPGPATRLRLQTGGAGHAHEQQPSALSMSYADPMNALSALSPHIVSSAADAEAAAIARTPSCAASALTQQQESVEGSLEARCAEEIASLLRTLHEADRTIDAERSLLGRAAALSTSVPLTDAADDSHAAAAAAAAAAPLAHQSAALRRSPTMAPVLTVAAPVIHASEDTRANPSGKAPEVRWSRAAELEERCRRLQQRLHQGDLAASSARAAPPAVPSG